jgi:hypothetical protein
MFDAPAPASSPSLSARRSSRATSISPEEGADYLARKGLSCSLLGNAACDWSLNAQDHAAWADVEGPGLYGAYRQHGRSLPKAEDWIISRTPFGVAERPAAADGGLRHSNDRQRVRCSTLPACPHSRSLGPGGAGLRQRRAALREHLAFAVESGAGTHGVRIPRASCWTGSWQTVRIPLQLFYGGAGLSRGSRPVMRRPVDVRIGRGLEFFSLTTLGAPACYVAMHSGPRAAGEILFRSRGAPDNSEFSSRG